MSSDNADETAEQEQFDLSLKGEGISVSRRISKESAATIINLLMGVAPGPAAVRTLVGSRIETQANSRPDGGRPSLRGFLNEVGAKNNMAIIAAMGAFLRDHENQAEFSREQIGPLFKSAGVPAPRNLPRDVRSAIARSWIAEDRQNPGMFYVTSDGDEAISLKFESERGSGPKKRRPKRSVAKAKDSEPLDD